MILNIIMPLKTEEMEMTVLQPCAQKSNNGTVAIAVLPRYQPQMDVLKGSDTPDTPKNALPTMLGSCLLGIFTYGIGGFSFLFCAKSPFAKAGVFLGTAVPLFVIAAFNLTNSSILDIVISSVLIILGICSTVKGVLLYREARREILPNIA
jgi:hypothetical protein